MDSTGNEQYGFNANFIGVVHDYLKCVVCHLVMKKPVQIMHCGHRFCRPCFERMQGYSKHLEKEFCCPIDREIVDINQVFDDTAISRDIGNLQVRCNQTFLGCSWSGILLSLQDHEKECQHGSKPISNVKNECTEEMDLFLKKLLQRVQQCELSLIEKENNMNNMKCNLDRMKVMIDMKNEEMESLKKLNIKEMKNLKDINEDLKDKFEKKISVLEEKLELLETLSDEQINDKLISKHIGILEKNLNQELSLLYNKEIKKIKKEFHKSCKLLHKEVLKVQHEMNDSSNETKTLHNDTQRVLDVISDEIIDLKACVDHNEKLIGDHDVKDLSNHIENLEKVLFCYEPWLKGNELKFKWVLSNFKCHFNRGESVESPIFYTQFNGYCLKFFVEWNGDEKENFGLFVNVSRGLIVEDDVDPFKKMFRFEMIHKSGKRLFKEFFISDRKDCFILPPGQQIANMTFGFAKFLDVNELQDYIINDQLFISCSYISN